LVQTLHPSLHGTTRKREPADSALETAAVCGRDGSTRRTTPTAARACGGTNRRHELSYGHHCRACDADYERAGAGDVDLEGGGLVRSPLVEERGHIGGGRALVGKAKKIHRSLVGKSGGKRR
jgi:hypothetical protein